MWFGGVVGCLRVGGLGVLCCWFWVRSEDLASVYFRFALYCGIIVPQLVVVYALDVLPVGWFVRVLFLSLLDLWFVVDCRCLCVCCLLLGVSIMVAVVDSVG